MLSRIASAYRVVLPDMPMVLIAAKNATERAPATATFRVLPKMTKHEVKEYLTKIYNLPVKKVNTMNYLGKRKQMMGKRRAAYFKYADYKKAIVTFDSSILDVGLGADMADGNEGVEAEEEEN